MHIRFWPPKHDMQHAFCKHSCMTVHASHACKHKQTLRHKQIRIENRLRLIGASCFWSSHGRCPRPLWFDILTAPVCVCVCEHCERPHFIKHIPRRGLSLVSSESNNSSFLDFVCFGVFTRHRFFTIAVETAIWLRKLIIDLFRQRGYGPLWAESKRLEGTLPEWAHFLHNPPQSSSSHRHAIK